MMSVPFAWMNMKREINSESCHVLMVSFLQQTSLNFNFQNEKLHAFDQEHLDVLTVIIKATDALLKLNIVLPLYDKENAKLNLNYGVI